MPPGYPARDSWRTSKQPLAAWAARGFTHINGAPLSGEGAYGLLLPAGPRGPAFLVSRNFNAIFSYNAAESYALAIALLSDRLRGRGPIVTPWPTDDPGLSRAGRREVQRLLIQHGYDIGGKIDAVLGHKTQEAIADFQRRSGLKPTGRASQSVLTALAQPLTDIKELNPFDDITLAEDDIRCTYFRDPQHFTRKCSRSPEFHRELTRAGRGLI